MVIRSRSNDDWQAPHAAALVPACLWSHANPPDRIPALIAPHPRPRARSPATGIVACVCQLFYAYRVFVVGKRSIWAPLAIAVLALLSLGKPSSLAPPASSPLLTFRTHLVFFFASVRGCVHSVDIPACPVHPLSREDVGRPNLAQSVAPTCSGEVGAPAVVGRLTFAYWAGGGVQSRPRRATA